MSLNTLVNLYYDKLISRISVSDVIGNNPQNIHSNWSGESLWFFAFHFFHFDISKYYISI